MELLLNLAWLLLALPGYWVWKGAQLHGVSTRRCLLVLACLLTLLFPVISATDDLHAMRAEMEESGTSKRTVARQSSGESGANGISGLQSPVLPAAAQLGLPVLQTGFLHLLFPSGFPTSRLVISCAGRGPPAPLSA